MNSNCRCIEDTDSDFVEFSNFNRGLKDRKLGRYCGTLEENARKEVASDGPFFRVTFKSNGVYDSSGFEAYYQFRKDEGKLIVHMLLLLCFRGRHVGFAFSVRLLHFFVTTITPLVCEFLKMEYLHPSAF